jgi:DNA polymerase III delta prime subunit
MAAQKNGAAQPPKSFNFLDLNSKAPALIVSKQNSRLKIGLGPPIDKSVDKIRERQLCNGTFLQYLAKITTPQIAKTAVSVLASLTPPSTVSAIQIRETKQQDAPAKRGNNSNRGRADDANQVWSEFYRPTKSRDLVGNQKAIQELQSWIQARYKNDPNARKAALLYGPPGVGKTTAAQVLAMEAGYDIYEINASDDRSAEKMHMQVGIVLNRKSLGKKVAIILDEVDGGETDNDFTQRIKASTTSESDAKKDDIKEKNQKSESGIAYLCRLIENESRPTSAPLIFICNSVREKSIRKLRELCLEIRFWPMDDRSLGSFVDRICASEGIELPQSDQFQLVSLARGDARKVVSLLQMYHQYEGKMQQFVTTSQDDYFLNIFEQIKSLLFANVTTDLLLFQCNCLFLEEPALFTEMIYENYWKLSALLMSYESPKKGIGQVFVDSCDVLEGLSVYDHMSKYTWQPEYASLHESLGHMSMLQCRKLNNKRLKSVSIVDQKFMKMDFPQNFTKKSQDRALQNAQFNVMNLLLVDQRIGRSSSDLPFYLEITKNRLAIFLDTDKTTDSEREEWIQTFYRAGIHPKRHSDFLLLVHHWRGAVDTRTLDIIGEGVSDLERRYGDMDDSRQRVIEIRRS